MIRIDTRSSTPIYEQVKLRIKELIVKGALKRGEKLPSVREMSSILTINPNTINKAYKELEKDGIIETLTGKGTFVTHDLNFIADEKKIKSIKQQLKNMILEAKCVSITKEEFVIVVKNIFDELEGAK